MAIGLLNIEEKYNMRQKPVLYIIIPCYNEEAVLPVTAPLFLQKLQEMIQLSLIQEESRILFVNDGSRDRTWKIISELSKEDPHYMGISQSRNRGHQYLEGNEIVYGVRSSRATDTFFKRFTAQSFYKILNWMGVEVVYNHADYRLISGRVLKEFQNFKEVNLYLRGMIPLVGFQSTTVSYERHERLAGESHSEH